MHNSEPKRWKRQTQSFHRFIGRFITEDTYKGTINNPASLNLYVYCYNNPINYIDPSGNVPTMDQIDKKLLNDGIITEEDIEKRKANIDYLYKKEIQDRNIDDAASIAIGFTPFDFIKDGADFVYGKDMTTGEEISRFLLFGCLVGPEATDQMLKNGRKLGNVLDGIAKTATKSNYRKLFLEQFPDLPKGWQVHHTLPQKYDDIMKSTGINIHEVQYLKGIDPKIHAKITNEWAKWEKSLGRKPTADDIIDFAKKIDKKYGEYWFNK